MKNESVICSRENVMAKKDRTIVGENITPTVLRELGTVDEFPRTPSDFQPEGNWTNNYRIWTCHGYRESGNQTVGSLRITRRTESEKGFILEVQQEIIQTDGQIEIIEARIKCLCDGLATPTESQLERRFKNLKDKSRSSRFIRKRIFSEGSIAGKASDWSLFESVQRMDFNEKSSISFDLLEGMSVLKEKHKLSYRGVYPMVIDTESVPLHCFVQLGRGILPTEYWLDSSHRLLTVISMNKAYILEE